MYKKITLLIISLVFLNFQNLHAIENIPEKPIIIPRESWWANELYTEVSSSYWKNILEKRRNQTDSRSPKKKKKDEENYKKSATYINDNFKNENTITLQENFDPNNWERYAWPLKYTDYVNAIVVHHTHSDYENSLEWIQDIYRYHSLNRTWWDIGYNYIIWYDGEIFEGRKGGDYVSAAHSRWNNYSTASIAVMGNYASEWVNAQQYKSLESLVQYLTWRYGIDLSKEYYYHMDCAGDKCITFPLETHLDSTLVWHRDTGHTSCPGDKLYEQIQKIRTDNLEFTQGFTPRKRSTTYLAENQKSTISTVRKYITLFRWYSNSDLELIWAKIEELLKEEDQEYERRKKLQIMRLGVILSMKD